MHCQLDCIYERKERAGYDNPDLFMSKAKQAIWKGCSPHESVGRIDMFSIRPSFDGENGGFLIFQVAYPVEERNGIVYYEHGAGFMWGKDTLLLKDVKIA